MSDKKIPKDYDFKMQALEAEQAEGKIQRLLSDIAGKKVELKTERMLWHETGNIVIEYESHGKPSGIAGTKADLWVHELRSQEDETLVYLMFPTPILKKICNDLMDEGEWRKGGENKKMEMIRLKLGDLFRRLQNFSGTGGKDFLTRNQRKKDLDKK